MAPSSTQLVAVAPEPAGGRGGLPAVAWLVGLTAVVAIGVFGRVAGPPDGANRGAIVTFDPPPPIRAGVGQALPQAPPLVAPMPDLIVLASPAVSNLTITSRELQVRGYVAADAASVRITLEARGNRVIDDATVVPALAPGGRPQADSPRWFSASFGLPNPRPNGRMILQVTALDRDGRLLDVIRRPFRVGVLLESD